MHRFKTYCLPIIFVIAATLFSPPHAGCETSGAQADSKYIPSINLKLNPDGLVVILSNNQQNLDRIRFSCDDNSNEIVIDLPADSDISVAGLQKNPNIVPNGIAAVASTNKDLKRIRITPKLKLYCSDIRMISKFQRYVTYLYPAGRNLKLTETRVKGFDFDDRNPQGQVSGSIHLIFDGPLGNIDLSDAVTAADNSLTVRLHQRDFVNQGMLATVFPAKELSTTYSASPGEHLLGFKTIKDAEIGKIKAKLFTSASSNELRIDITLTVALYETGKKYYQQGNTAKALLYLNAAKNEPGLALASRMSVGSIHWNEDNYAEALKSFRELISLDRSWEFADARYFAAKAYHSTNQQLSFDLSALLKEYLRRCDRMKYPMCEDARELSELVNEPALKLNLASKIELKKLVARLADPKGNFNEVQKNVFHYWATWCPLCLEEMPKIMKYAVAHPNIDIYIVAKHDNQKLILNTLLKSGAIRRKNIFYYIDTKDDIMLRQMVPLILANKEPVTPLPISVFLQRDLPFHLTEKLNWTDSELAPIWQLKYRE